MLGFHTETVPESAGDVAWLCPELRSAGPQRAPAHLNEVCALCPECPFSCGGGEGWTLWGLRPRPCREGEEGETVRGDDPRPGTG